jgi:hypothetical protein
MKFYPQCHVNKHDMLSHAQRKIAASAMRCTMYGNVMHDLST